MDFGKLRYHIAIKPKAEVKVEAKAENLAVKKKAHSVERIACKTLVLTLIDMNDEDILSSQGLSELRKKRIVRLTEEAQKQGMLLSYEDLNALLLSSVSTLKRDVSSIEKKGYIVPLRRRKVSEVSEVSKVSKVSKGEKDETI